jgi:hypothetical protein
MITSSYWVFVLVLNQQDFSILKNTYHPLKLAMQFYRVSLMIFHCYS